MNFIKNMFKLFGKRKFWLIVGALILITGVSAMMVGKKNPPNKPDQMAEKRPVLEFAPADLAEVKLQQLSQAIPLTGDLQPTKQAIVKSKTSATVIETLMREGDRVKKGQVLARLDAIELRARLDQQMGNLEAGKAQFALAEKTRANNQALLKQNFISQNAFDTAQSNYLVNQAQLKALQAQVEIARTALSDTVIHAPMDGIVAKRYVQAGEKVNPDSAVYSVVDLTNLELKALVPASEIPNVSVGQQVNIHVDGFGDRVFNGRVERINPTAEAGSRAIPIYVTTSNTEGILKGGMFASGRLNLANTGPIPAIDISAVHVENGQSFVYVLVNGKIARQNIVTGVKNEQDGLIEIKSGLKVGSQVIVGKFERLKEGDAAIVKAPNQPQMGKA